jgi:hypothetical protein
VTSLAPHSSECGHTLPLTAQLRIHLCDSPDALSDCRALIAQHKCPDWRCAPNVIGPGGSILGANCHEDVLTVGAVRADGMWLGYSAQGPGQPRMARKKPDLCASSQFREDDNAFATNTGTSAAGGMAAGVVAALRSNWNQARVAPLKLKKILNDTARKPPGLAWGNDLGQRLGNGILDAEAAFKELARQYP